MPLLQQAFVIVLLSLAIAAMPVQTPDAGSACTEGTIKTNPHLLNCRNETPSIPVTERNEVLTWLICDALALRKKAQGVCRQLSNCSVSTYIRLYIYIYISAAHNCNEGVSLLYSYSYNVGCYNVSLLIAFA